MRTSVIALIALIIVAVSFDTALAQTSARDDECIGTDLIFLIDESDSMLVNDPDYLRIAAVRTAIAALGDNAMYFCPGVYHRIAAIGFGDSAYGRPDTENYLITMVSPTIEGLDEWRVKRQELLDLLPLRTSGLGGTDYMSAFAAARTVLDVWADESSTSTDTSTELRRRGVIVISDGGPCIIDDGCNNNAPDDMDIDGYMNDLSTYLDALGASFPWQDNDHPSSVRIWFVGIRDTTVQPESEYLNPASNLGRAVLPAWDRIVKSHGGSLSFRNVNSIDRAADDFFFFEDVPDIATEVVKILDQVVSRSLASETRVHSLCDPFYIAPYSDGLILMLLYDDINEDTRELTIQYLGPFDPTKTVVKRGMIVGDDLALVDYLTSDNAERYIFSGPRPGTWQFVIQNGTCDGLEARIMVTQGLVGTIVEPSNHEAFRQHESSPYYDPVRPSHLRYVIKVRDSFSGNVSDAPISIMDNFPISVGSEVVSPIGSKQTLELERQVSGVWESTEPLRLPIAGEYSWSISASAPDGKLTGVVNILGDEGTFVVTGSNQFGFSIVKPLAGKPLPSMSSEEAQDTEIALPVEVQLTNSIGQPLALDVVQYLGSRDLLSTELMVGQAIVAASPMTLNLNSGLFEASLDLGNVVANSSTDVDEKSLVVVRLDAEGLQSTGFNLLGEYARAVDLGDQSDGSFVTPPLQELDKLLVPIVVVVVVVLLVAAGLWLLVKARDSGQRVQQARSPSSERERTSRSDIRRSDALEVHEPVSPRSTASSAPLSAQTLTPSEHRHLEAQQTELEQRRLTLSKRIEALDTDIGRELDSERKMVLQERRQGLVDERQQVVEQLAIIEQQLDR